MADIKQWLDTLHLPQYYSLLINSGYTSLANCTTITEKDLIKIDVSLPGHRKRILAHLPPFVEDGIEAEYGNIPINNPNLVLSKISCKSFSETLKGHPEMNEGSQINAKSVQDEDEDIYDVPIPREDISIDPKGCKLAQVNEPLLQDHAITSVPPVLPPKNVFHMKI